MITDSFCLPHSQFSSNLSKIAAIKNLKNLSKFKKKGICFPSCNTPSIHPSVLNICGSEPFNYTHLHSPLTSTQLIQGLSSPKTSSFLNWQKTLPKTCLISYHLKWLKACCDTMQHFFYESAFSLLTVSLPSAAFQVSSA